MDKVGALFPAFPDFCLSLVISTHFACQIAHFCGEREFLAMNKLLNVKSIERAKTGLEDLINNSRTLQFGYVSTYFKKAATVLLFANLFLLQGKYVRTLCSSCSRDYVIVTIS